MMLVNYSPLYISVSINYRNGRIKLLRFMHSGSSSTITINPDTEVKPNTTSNANPNDSTLTRDLPITSCKGNDTITNTYSEVSLLDDVPFSFSDDKEDDIVSRKDIRVIYNIYVVPFNSFSNMWTTDQILKRTFLKIISLDSTVTTSNENKILVTNIHRITNKKLSDKIFTIPEGKRSILEESCDLVQRLRSNRLQLPTHIRKFFPIKGLNAFVEKLSNKLQSSVILNNTTHFNPSQYRYAFKMFFNKLLPLHKTNNYSTIEVIQKKLINARDLKLFTHKNSFLINCTLEDLEKTIIRKSTLNESAPSKANSILNENTTTST